MKRFIYIFLLLAVTIQSTGSIWIYLGFQLNREYIANQLCVNRFDSIPLCNGYCYLEDKIKEEKKSNDAQIKIKIIEVMVVLPAFDLKYLKNINAQLVEDLVFAPSTSEPLSDGFYVSIFKPPLFLS